MTDMVLLHRIGPRHSSNWNTLEEILALPVETPLSFDGVYTEVYDNYKALAGRPITFFVTGKYVGDTNDFDIASEWGSTEKPGRFCTWAQLCEMAGELGARLAYHGWAHKKCVGMTPEELVNELAGLPAGFAPVIAWPHGVCDENAIMAAQAMGCREAYCAGGNGDGSQFQRQRKYLNW